MTDMEMCGAEAVRMAQALDTQSDTMIVVSLLVYVTGVFVGILLGEES